MELMCQRILNMVIAVVSTVKQEASVQEASVQEASVQETSVQETSVQEASVQEASVQETSVQKASVREAMAQEEIVVIINNTPVVLHMGEVVVLRASLCHSLLIESHLKTKDL